MNPNKVIRENVRQLTDLPNIGKASAADLVLLGITYPQQLIGRDPFQMYQELCVITQQRHDPCVIDVFIAITRFMAGEPPRVWWDFTEERKKILSQARVC
ncbi:helix-hairpin-helix domain-containing protein [Undibacterium flavidum]|uniref:Helix-hairpin-helix domain-containing protein n=1 Tax=Undibacterium flavidum TaxID=2762297 RepID=A0ABR6Y7N7_9BURK|nr:helix-hairpin-helix domain-containing protein [Undibacterium flavidum]MBC3872638.1 helix-hairpin-helix domain-containing protein [Undibacterium flavidum]